MPNRRRLRTSKEWECRSTGTRRLMVIRHGAGERAEVLNRYAIEILNTIRSLRQQIP